MRRYTDYHEALSFAIDYSNRLNMDVAIRRTREYGKDGFNVSLAGPDERVCSEIVSPGTPHSEKTLAKNAGIPR